MLREKNQQTNNNSNRNYYQQGMMHCAVCLCTMHIVYNAVRMEVIGGANRTLHFISCYVSKHTSIPIYEMIRINLHVYTDITNTIAVD